MECGDPYLLRTETDDLIYPHLTRRLIGEGNRHDLIRIHTLLLDQPGHSMCEHPCLAGTSSGQDQDRPLGLHHRLLLSLV